MARAGFAGLSIAVNHPLPINLAEETGLMVPIGALLHGETPASDASSGTAAGWR